MNADGAAYPLYKMDSHTNGLHADQMLTLVEVKGGYGRNCGRRGGTESLSTTSAADSTAGQTPIHRLVHTPALWMSTSHRRCLLGRFDQDTTSESTRNQRRCHAGSGPRRPKGHDRLMEKVPPRSDSAPAVCPICGEAPSARALRNDHGINVADYRDHAGHIWTTKWMVPA